MDSLNQSKISISTKTCYQELESSPSASKYIYQYKVKIENGSKETVQLIARHWVIKDAFENIEEVKGAGVIGKQPILKPGESFEYESYCPLPTKTGSMRGWYEFQKESGERFLSEIPEFYFFDPHTLH